MTHGFHPAAVAATTDEARRSRPLAARLIAASPRRAERLGRAGASLAPARLRTAYLRWVAGVVFDAWTRRDWEVNTLVMHPSDYEFRVGEAGRLLPDMRELYAGVEGYLESQLAILDVFPDLVVETASVGLAGPDRLVATLRWQGTAAGSGVAIDQRLLTVADFPKGTVVRQWYWFDPEAGLRKLGLEPRGLTAAGSRRGAAR